MDATSEISNRDMEKGPNPHTDIQSRPASLSSSIDSPIDAHAQPHLLRPENWIDQPGSEELPRQLGRVHSKFSAAKARCKSAYCRFTGSGEAEEKMGWKSTACLMIAETISLGILSLPAAVSIVGLVPGMALIIVSGIVTTLTGRLLHAMRMRNPDHEITDYPTAVGVIWGAWGRWTAELLFWIFFTFLMAGHVVLFRNMLISMAGGRSSMCTLISTGIGAFVMGLMTLPRAFKAVSRLSIFTSFSIVCATFAVLIDLAIKNHGDSSHWLAVTALDNGFERYSQVFLAVSNIVVSFTGHCCYFNIMAEMKKPEDFPKALYWTNGVTISMYLISGVAIYALAGIGVKSPALSSSTKIGQQIAYGLAIPTIVVAGVILALVAAKRVYKLNAKLFKSLEDEKRGGSWWAWDLCVLMQWVFAWVIANGVPFFGSLLGLLGGLCGVPICLLFPSAFWLFNLRKTYTGPNWRKCTYNALLGTMFCIGLMLMGLGLYGSISEIHYLMAEGATKGWKPFGCQVPTGTV